MTTPAQKTRLAPRLSLLRAGLILISLLAATAAQAYTPNLATVPWLGNPALPHQVYSGGPLVLQGVATDLDNGAALCVASATWDSGAGPTYPAGTNGYALEATHTYVGAVGQPFTATLTVTLCDTTVLTDTMRVVVRADNQEVRVNMAIDKGLWNLHKRIIRTTSDTLASGYWTGANIQGNSWYPAATASSVQAFEINNHRESGNVAEDPYVDDVVRGLRLLLSAQHSALQNTSVALQNGSDNPDGSIPPNGFGLGVNYGAHASYITGQLIDALVASGTPNQLAETGNLTYVKGRKYVDIVQDLLDGYSHGMHDATGGWWYQLESFGGLWYRNDTSASHWWAIGVLAAETWALDAPQWVKTRQWTIGVPLMQRFSAADQTNNTCWFGYTNNSNYAWDLGLNTTAAGLILMNADDVLPTHPRYTCAANYINNRFNSTLGNFYSMYQLTKAMRTAQGGSIDLLVGSRDWYAAYADHLVANQSAAGAFTSTVGTVSQYLKLDLATSWGLIMLAPSLFELPPTAACNASPLIDGTAAIGGNVNFDGSQSAHPDAERTIVSYSWAFNDGSAPGTASGVTTSHSFANVGIYNVVLTVEDDNGNKDTDTCQIDVRDNDIPPASRPGGPYEICLGDTLELDGSASSDLDNQIVLYEWDWNSPINFVLVDSTLISPSVSGAPFTAVGLYDVGLQVTDNDGDNGGSDHTTSSFTTVNVIPADDPSCNQPPVAVCTDAEVSADGFCKGAPASVDDGSFDPDGAGDILSIIEIPGSPYDLGSTAVTLTITDQSDESDSCIGTVTVVDDTPPSITCPDNTVVECGPNADTSVTANGTATADDNCSVESIGHSDSSAPMCGVTETITRTWTATDGAGLTASCDQLIEVVDTTPPVLTVDTTPITVIDTDCSLDEPVTLPVASATDDCDANPTVSNDAPDPFIAGLTTTVTYTATDACSATSTSSTDTVDVTVLHGANIAIFANKHTVGGGSFPGSNKEPLVGIEVGAYDKLGENSCSRSVCGGISHQHYQCIVDSCDAVASCTTDANGECTINAPPGDYIVISEDATKTTLPDPLGVSASDLVCGETKQKHLQQIIKSNGKKMPGKTTKRTGSELLIIEPEFVEWTGTEELYPIIFESAEEWETTTSVTPPEGFVSDYDNLSEVVIDEIEAVQFTITDVGSEWVPTGTTYTVEHNGRREIVHSRIGVRLSKGLALAKGLDRNGHVLGLNGRPIPHKGFDPRGEWPVAMVGWIEPSVVDTGWTIKIEVSATSDLELEITRGQGKVVQTLAIGSFSPGEYEFYWNPAQLGRGKHFVRLTSGELVQKQMLISDQ